MKLKEDARFAHSWEHGNVAEPERGTSPKISDRFLERNRKILREYYQLVDKDRIARNTACGILKKRWGMSAKNIRIILKKMRGEQIR